MKKIFFIIVISMGFLFLTHSFIRADERSNFLINDLITNFKNTGVRGQAGIEEFQHSLNNYMKKARELKAQGSIDKIFFDRYWRLLAVLKIVFIDDPERILTPLLVESINKFVTTVEEIQQSKFKGHARVTLVAESLYKELADLYEYLLNKPIPFKPFPIIETIPFNHLILKEGTYYLKDKNIPFSGTAIKKYEDGKTKEKIRIKNGRMEGQRILFDRHGEKTAEGLMKNNEKSGCWIYYDFKGDIDTIVNCNYLLRVTVRQFITELERGNPEEAMKNLEKAIEINPLKKLLEIKNHFPLLQMAACSNAGKYDCAIKYARMWAQQTKNSAVDGRTKAEAFYRLGYCCWVKISKLGDQLSNEDKEKTIEEGMQAFKKSTQYSESFADPHAYIGSLYMLKAQLDPAKKEEYVRKGELSNKKFTTLYKARRGSFTNKGRDKKGEFKKENVYEIQEDQLSDTGLVVSLPALPPPPPARKKRKISIKDAIQRVDNKLFVEEILGDKRKKVSYKEAYNEAISNVKIEQPKLIKSTQPKYPPEALKAYIQGNVIINVVTDTKGRVVEAKVINGHPILRSAAVEAVKKWQYEPYILNGVPRSIKFTVVVKFNLNNNKKIQ